jgi:hypothetical protein
MSLTLQSTYKLVSGYEIPVVGFGVSMNSNKCHDPWLILVFVLGLPNVG